MNAFAKLALLNSIESIESQLRSLKTLIGNVEAAGDVTAPAGGVMRSSRIVPKDDLTEDEEEKLALAIKEAQEAEVQKMRDKASQFFEQNAQNIIGGMASVQVPTPPPHPFELENAGS